MFGAAEVVPVSDLTDWERRQLDDLGRYLAQEDPRLAASLSRPVPAPRRRLPAPGAVGWAMLCLGLPLLLCGAVLGIAGMTVVAFLMLATCWIPFAVRRARRAGFS